MSDAFIDKNIKPMLIGHNYEPYDDENSIFELKLDGIRCVVYVDDKSIVLKNKRNKDVTDVYPELHDIYKNVKEKCILDGEIIVLKNGRPDFFSVQKRSLMTNKFKINMCIKNMPVTFVAFDILYFKNKEIMDLPLIKRKQILNDNIIENKYIAVSRYIEKEGIKFFNLAVLNKLEGIVGKKKDSIYIEGIRTKNWKKIKVMVDEDVIICGYDLKNGDINGLILGIYEDDRLICRGKVSLGISKDDKKIILEYSNENKIEDPYFRGYKDVIWIKLGLIGRVEYMHETDNKHMRQPVWKGLRDDKELYECVI